MIEFIDVVYLAGPMTGLPDANRAAFVDAERMLRRKYGCKVLNPATHPDGLRYARYMSMALDKLDQASAILMLPGWEQSAGAQFERLCAERDGKRIYYLTKPGTVTP